MATEDQSGFEYDNDNDAWTTVGHSGALDEDFDVQRIARMMSEDADAPQSRAATSSLFDAAGLHDASHFEQMLKQNDGAGKGGSVWKKAPAAPSAYTVPTHVPHLGGAATGQASDPTLRTGMDVQQWLSQMGLSSAPLSSPASTDPASAPAPVPSVPSPSMARAHVGHQDPMTKSAGVWGPVPAASPVYPSHIAGPTLTTEADLRQYLESMSVAHPASSDVDVLGSTPTSALAMPPGPAQHAHNLDALTAAAASTGRPPAPEVPPGAAPSLGTPTGIASPTATRAHSTQDRSALQKIETQLAFQSSQREIALAQLHKVREQLAAHKGGGDVTRSLRGAEQQLVVRINFIDTETTRLESMQRTAGSPPDASAQLRALRLQSGQMFAAIKALSANITKLAAEGPRLDPNASRQLQLLKQQRQNVNMQLHRVRAQIQNIESQRQSLPADSGRVEFTDLMGEDEKQQLINIQRMQMHSDNPFIDDYYYVMHTRRLSNLPITVRLSSLAFDAAPAPAPAAPAPLVSTVSAPAALPVTDTADRPHAQPTGLHFEKTLGSIAYSSTRAPRALVSIENTESAVTDPASTTITWRDAGRAVETSYSSVLRLEDIERLAAEPGADRRALFEQRQLIITSVVTALGVAGLNTSRDAAVVNHVLSTRKGLRLLGRLTPFLSLEQFVSLLISILRSPIAPESAFQQHFGNPAIGKIGEMQLPQVRRVLESLAALRLAPEPLPLNDFHAILVYFVVRRAEAIVQHPALPVARELDQLLDPLTHRMTQALARLVAERCNVPVWQLIFTLTQHVTPPTRAALAAALGPSLDRDSHNQMVAALRQALRV